MVENVCPLPWAGQNCLFYPLAFHVEVANALPVMRLATKKLLVSVDSVVGLEPLATTLTDTHMATVRPNCVLVSRLQRFISLDTYITVVKLFFLVCSVPHTDPIQQQHEFPDKPTLDIFRSMCQQMSAPLYLFLKAYLSLEDNLADDKADPSACYQLA